MNKCDASKIKVGDYFSRISYGKVTRIIEGRGTSKLGIEVQNEDGDVWSIENPIVETEFFIHNQFNIEEEVSLTQAAELVIVNPRIILSLSFNKKVDIKELKEEIDKLYHQSDTKWSFKQMIFESIIGNGIKGEERTMIGYHLGRFDKLGYLQFIDLEVEKDNSKEYDNRIKRVNTGSLNWVIVNNKKYKVKE